MSKRLAIVIWWIGLLALAAGAVGAFSIFFDQLNQERAYVVCSYEADVQMKNKREEAARVTQSVDVLVPKTGQERDALMSRDFGDWLEKHKNDPPPLECRQPSAQWFPALALGTCAAVLCFAVCFILGGSFWRPPRVSRP